jgi:hypothetical protein
MVVVESNLQSSCEGIQTAICNTNAAFECRLVGLRRVKAQLEQEHEQVGTKLGISEPSFIHSIYIDFNKYSKH